MSHEFKYRGKQKDCQRQNKKEANPFFKASASFFGRLRKKEFGDYHPPPQARTGTIEAITVTATINISIIIFFINVTSLK